MEIRIDGVLIANVDDNIIGVFNEFYMLVHDKKSQRYSFKPEYWDIILFLRQCRRYYLVECKEARRESMENIEALWNRIKSCEKSLVQDVFNYVCEQVDVGKLITLTPGHELGEVGVRHDDQHRWSIETCRQAMMEFEAYKGIAYMIVSEAFRIHSGYLKRMFFVDSGAFNWVNFTHYMDGGYWMEKRIRSNIVHLEKIVKDLNGKFLIATDPYSKLGMVDPRCVAFSALDPEYRPLIRALSCWKYHFSNDKYFELRQAFRDPSQRVRIGLAFAFKTKDVENKWQGEAINYRNILKITWESYETGEEMSIGIDTLLLKEARKYTRQTRKHHAY